MFVRHGVALAAVVAVIALTSCATGSGTSPSASRTGTAGSTSASSPAAAGTPAITISTPAPDATVAVPFSVSGEANTFEAALTIDAQDASGMTACVRHLTASSGSGTPGTWEGVLAFPPEEDPLELTLRAYSQSPADGSMINLVEVPITVTPDRPLIVLTSPRCGDVYQPGGLLILTGTANLFEAALTVELRDSSGTAVVTLPVTAEECCEESQFNATLTVPADLSAGFYDVVAYSLSAQDGSVENEFPVQVEVRGGLPITG
jgi:hypothetical protein